MCTPVSPECECSCAHQCPRIRVFMCTPVSQNVSVHVHTIVPECECSCAHQCPQNVSVHVHTSVPEYECSCAHQCPRIRVFMCTPVSQNASVHVHTSVPECECSCAHQCPQNVSVHVHTSVPEYECSCAHQCPRMRVYMCNFVLSSLVPRPKYITASGGIHHHTVLYRM